MTSKVRRFCCCEGQGKRYGWKWYCVVGDALGKHSLCWIVCFYSDTLVSVRLCSRLGQSSQLTGFLKDLYSAADDAQAEARG